MNINYDIRGYAMVTDDNKIAPAPGEAYTLRNAKDWEYYQAALHAADMIVFGSLSHVNEPLIPGQLRLVVSRQGSGLEHRADGWWWDPGRVPWLEAAGKALPAGGIVAVSGGQVPFDLFLRLGYTEFHLSRFLGRTLPGGRALFSACEDLAVSAEDALAKSGMKLSKKIDLDPADRVQMNVWRRG